MNRQRRTFFALLTSALVGAGSSASAADDPIVNVVMQTTTKATFDAPLPASVYFKLQYKVDDPTQMAATVRVWPRFGKETCRSVQIDDVRSRQQFHELAMASSGSGASAVLATRIPPLQVGQSFCVAIQTFVPVAGVALDNLATNVASDVATDVAAGTALDASVAQRLGERFHKFFDRQLHDAKPAASKIGELVNVQLVLDYTAAFKEQAAIAAQVAAAKPPLPPDAQAKQADALKKVSDTKGALIGAIVAAIKSPLVTPRLVYEDVSSTAGLAGDGTTPAAANYAAIDTGVVAAFPLAYAGGDGSPWVLPYIGLNLYFVPVDRTVALDELVDPVLQRLSLTVGRTLSNPSIPNRTITDFGFGFPLLAAGYRVSQFIRATAGAVFYRTNVANPTSTETTFGVAPFVGLSLDGDVIAIAQGKLTAPK